MISEAAAKHAGLVMAHAAEGENRRSIEFESETQDRALDRAWSSLVEYRDHVDLWAMAREGLIAAETGKDDVLVVAAWAPGMPDAVVDVVRCRPTNCCRRCVMKASQVEKLTLELEAEENRLRQHLLMRPAGRG
jgi:hypothetical protein